MQQRSEITRAKILSAAEQEFSEKGFYGARINEIAEVSQVNKALIYKYFGDKEELYQCVLLSVYERLKDLESQIIASSNSDYRQKLSGFIDIYFQFLEDNPTYVRMVMWENLNHAKYFKARQVNKTKDSIIKALDQIVIEAKASHRIPDSVDSKQLMLTLIACSFNYFSNMDTLTEIVQADLRSEESQRKRIKAVKDMLLAYMDSGGCDDRCEG
ncbi:MAG: TetR/AcrR family transcriptional regulator [Sphaerochaetaceae bacterium]|jgi:AcrR family transcriptional regulator|nr:TetR/AcrR family transcriptional regulator [Sphaerochaetaceae bacterium]